MKSYTKFISIVVNLGALVLIVPLVLKNDIAMKGAMTLFALSLLGESIFLFCYPNPKKTLMRTLSMIVLIIAGCLLYSLF